MKDVWRSPEAEGVIVGVTGRKQSLKVNKDLLPGGAQ